MCTTKNIGTSLCLEKDEPFTQLLSKADRGHDHMPLDTSARLAKPETAVSKTPQQQDLAVLLHHLETGETKRKEVPHSEICN